MERKSVETVYVNEHYKVGRDAYLEHSILHWEEWFENMEYNIMAAKLDESISMNVEPTLQQYIDGLLSVASRQDLEIIERAQIRGRIRAFEEYEDTARGKPTRQLLTY